MLVKEVSQRHDWFGRPINGDWFEACVPRVLVPELRPGDIVIMDNVSRCQRQSRKPRIRLTR